MTCAARLSFPINNSRVSVLIFVRSNAYFMSVVQSVCFSSGRNTLRERVFMYHHRHVFCSASFPLPLVSLRGVDCLVSGVMMAVVVGIVYG